MVFSEAIKKEVRQKASFRCCRCEAIDVEVHHIIPQEKDGLDTIENAAPLCPNCHTNFGDNVKKRKIIKEMRDVWYKRVEEMYKPKDLLQLEKISIALANLNENLPELKKDLKEFVNSKIEGITSDTAQATASNIVSSVAGVSATKLGPNVYSNLECAKCHNRVGLLIGTDKCPACGEPIVSD